MSLAQMADVVQKRLALVGEIDLGSDKVFGEETLSHNDCHQILSIIIFAQPTASQPVHCTKGMHRIIIFPSSSIY